jgi:hypothetical protein
MYMPAIWRFLGYDALPTGQHAGQATGSAANQPRASQKESAERSVDPARCELERGNREPPSGFLVRVARFLDDDGERLFISHRDG